MIVDNIENFHKYIPLNKYFAEVENYLQSDYLKELQTGSYEIDGKNLYVNIDEYQTKEDSLPEAHREYIDIQIVMSGHEKIGFAPLNDGKCEILYNEDRDIEFLTASCEYLKAEPGKFFIFYPQDIHQPCLTDKTVSTVKKAVFKIKINC